MSYPSGGIDIGQLSIDWCANCTNSMGITTLQPRYFAMVPVGNVMSVLAINSAPINALPANGATFLNQVSTVINQIHSLSSDLLAADHRHHGHNPNIVTADYNPRNPPHLILVGLTSSTAAVGAALAASGIALAALGYNIFSGAGGFAAAATLVAGGAGLSSAAILGLVTGSLLLVVGVAAAVYIGYKVWTVINNAPTPLSPQAARSQKRRYRNIKSPLAAVVASSRRRPQYLRASYTRMDLPSVSAK